MAEPGRVQRHTLRASIIAVPARRATVRAPEPLDAVAGLARVPSGTRLRIEVVEAVGVRGAPPDELQIIPVIRPHRVALAVDTRVGRHLNGARK